VAVDGTVVAGMPFEVTMLFRQLFDKETSTYTYLVADEATKEAALIDPVLEQLERDLEIVRELGLRLVRVLDTHVHADHVTAAGRLRERSGALTVGGQGGAPCTDLAVGHGDIVRIGAIELHVLGTPGHTSESVSYLLGDRVLTGDALLIRAAGRTDFQNGDAGQLYDTLTQVLFALPDETLVYPAHDYRGRTVSTIGEEKRFNTRVAGRTREEFVAVMDGLHLPEPARLREAVPANRACGIAPPPMQG
jgi:sulfur dioxygenase